MDGVMNITKRIDDAAAAEIAKIRADADAEIVLGIAKADEVVGAALAGKTLVKEIVVPNKIVNLVVK